MSIVEKMARAIAEKLTDAPWECACSERRGPDCDCGDAMDDDHVDRYDERLTRNMCRDTARAALTATGLTEAQLEGLANGTMVVVPRETLKWWRELVDINPQDLAPRMDAMLAAKEG